MPQDRQPVRRLLAFLPLLLLLASAAPLAIAQSSTDDALTDRVQRGIGLYITGPFVRVYGAEGVVRLITRSRMDIAVIDFKDAAGRVNHDTAIPELEEQESRLLGDTAALVRTLKEANIHTVARIVCFADPVMAHRFPDRAILDVRAHQRGATRVWTSWGTGGAWLNPWDTRNHDMIIALAREAEALGFEEIQLDYIRFPVDDGIPFAHYEHEQEGVLRRDMLHAFLGRLDAAIRIPISVDVFGIQAFHEGDSSGLGQDLALWRDHVEIYSPMLYLNAMRNWERGMPNRAERLLHIGISRMRERLGPGPIIRPFLQAFEREAENWGPNFIANQIRGARSGGSDGFLFWHPGSNYGVVQRAMQNQARSLAPFTIPQERLDARR